MSENLHFPTRLIVKFINRLDRSPIPALAIILTLYARQKNDYSIARVTRRDGSILITKFEVKASILQDKELFIMDYASEMEECRPEIQIKICSPEDVRKSVLAMETFKNVTKIDESLIKGFKESQNHLYQPAKTKVLLDQDCPEREIEIDAQPLTR